MSGTPAITADKPREEVDLLHILFPSGGRRSRLSTDSEECCDMWTDMTYRMTKSQKYSQTEIFAYDVKTPAQRETETIPHHASGHEDPAFHSILRRCEGMDNVYVIARVCVCVWMCHGEISSPPVRLLYHRVCVNAQKIDDFSASQKQTFTYL